MVVDLLNFDSGSQIKINDTELLLTFGKKDNSQFAISLVDVAKAVFAGKSLDSVRVEIKDEKLVIEQLFDYDGEVLVSVDKIPEERKIGNKYSQEFDTYETYVIICISRYQLIFSVQGVEAVVSRLKESEYTLNR